MMKHHLTIYTQKNCMTSVLCFSISFLCLQYIPHFSQILSTFCTFILYSFLFCAKIQKCMTSVLMCVNPLLVVSVLSTFLTVINCNEETSLTIYTQNYMSSVLVFFQNLFLTFWKYSLLSKLFSHIFLVPLYFQNYYRT